MPAFGYLPQPKAENRPLTTISFKAGDGIRTRECQLGRLMPYPLATPARVSILPTNGVGDKTAPWQDWVQKFIIICQ
jgi:hypothetical protein